MFGALGIFLWECARQWMAHRHWRRGALNLLLTAVFVILLGVNLVSLCSVFFPQVTPAFTPFGWALNWPLLSACLLCTLLWRQQRAQSATNRRRVASAHKLHEQIGIHFAQQQYLAMLVHEIKTPLTLVQLGTKALTQAEVSSERKSIWEVRMQTAVNSMVQILDTCGQAERYEGGAIAISPTLVSAPAILQEVVEQASYISGALPGRLQLRYESPAAELALYTDASYLQIILNNLVGNALKYSPSDTTVHVQVGRQLGTQGMAQLQFAVINQVGQAGLPDPTKVFERYYRAPRASSVSGTGLGLWLSQKLAQRLGGTISMTLEAGRVVFWFSLPAHTAAAALQAKPKRTNAKP
jgi:signal transduction histidine kinase